MLLSFGEFRDKVQALSKGDCVAVDFETTGLSVYRGARAFLVGFACTGGFTYFEWIDDTSADRMRILLGNAHIRYAAHNAKFELSFLRHQFDVEVAGDVWDTQVFARLCSNDELRYDLDTVAERAGFVGKFAPFLEWKKANRKKGFEEAPRDLLEKYVVHDAVLSLQLYAHQRRTLSGMNSSMPLPLVDLIHLEMRTTKHLFEMESHGIMVDLHYVHAGAAYEEQRFHEATQQLELHFGGEFTDSSKFLSGYLESQGIKLPRTEKGAPSIAYDSLVPYRSSNVVGLILARRESQKRLETYWKGLLEFGGVDGIVHGNIRQSGTASARFSSHSPNLQNLPADDGDSAYPIRRAFVAPAGFKIVSIDYAQMELRMIADLAGEEQLYLDIMAGVDLHQRVATQANVSRQLGKTARFLRLYAGSAKKLAATFGCSLSEAERVCAALDADTPHITRYSGRVRGDAKARGVLQNWMGRPYRFTTQNYYKAPNYMIQGGCSDVLRKAIDEIAALLRDEPARMLVPIHDELVFVIREDRVAWLAPLLAQKMREAYPHKRVPFDVSVSVGDNLHDLEEVKV